ncbi:MAG TPA: anthranilate synthase component I [Mycobacteriales bacterium]|jgi:anthranilate synthase component 1|nr:anthranilate synthase component I [Mycobacteriales bacterium]
MSGSGAPDGIDRPDRESFLEAFGRDRVVPVVRRVLADAETPISAYRKLAGGRPGTFLLESAEHGGMWARYSFVGVRSAATLSERDGKAVWTGIGPDDHPEDPLAALHDAAARLHTARDPELPPLTCGLVGYLGYDAVRRMERLPVIAEDDIAMPELHFLLATDVAVLDHRDGSILLVANVIHGLTPGADADPGAAYDDAVARLDSMVADLSKPSESSVATLARGTVPPYEERSTRDDYMAAVEAAKEHIRAGDCFQIVVSQRFETKTNADPLDVYRALRTSNPSPYMYLLRFGDLDVVGSSPEALVKVEGTRALMHPIAGTRPRGATPEADTALAAELLSDPKERAEHVMLVDLGRNDLGRIATAGSVEVVDLMTVERFSHVMHLVSTVVCEVAPSVSSLDVLCACFPAGTLSGAPKVRAMEVIEALEPTRRGLYGGVVGYVDVAGDLDTAVAIRTVVMRDGHAYVQAGAGIVADSDPSLEDTESRNKAAAVLAALASAEALRPAEG